MGKVKWISQFKQHAEINTSIQNIMLNFKWQASNLFQYWFYSAIPLNFSCNNAIKSLLVVRRAVFTFDRISDTEWRLLKFCHLNIIRWKQIKNGKLLSKNMDNSYDSISIFNLTFFCKYKFKWQLINRCYCLY